MSTPSATPSRCVVYKSLRRVDTYVFLAVDRAPLDLPAAVRDALAPLAWLMELDLASTRKLARIEPAALIAALRDHGYYLQLPPPPDAPPFRA